MNFELLKKSTQIRYTKAKINVLKKHIIYEAKQLEPNIERIKHLGQQLNDEQEILKKLEE